MKKIVKVLAWVLCFALIVPEFSVPVFAAEVQEISQSETSEEGTEEDSEEQTANDGVSSDMEVDVEVDDAVEEETPIPTERPEASEEPTATPEETVDEEVVEELPEEVPGEEVEKSVLPEELPEESNAVKSEEMIEEEKSNPKKVVSPPVVEPTIRQEVEISLQGSANVNDAVNWANNQVGKSLDYDGVYGAQCVDLIAYYYRYLGKTTPGGNAIDYATNELPEGAGWYRVYEQYQPGDIAVWYANHSCSTCNTSSLGHVGIVTSADSSYINVIDQNGPSNKGYCKANTYKVSAIKCAIRPKWDDVAPIINSSWYSHVDRDRFTIVANVSDNVGVTRVVFPTWRADTQTGEHAIWVEGIKQADGTWAATIEVSNYGNAETTYITHIYAYDASGNYISGGNSIYIDRTPPMGSDVQVERIADDIIKVSCEVIDATGVERVVFPTWTDYNGQDDVAEDWDNNCKGTKEGNRWVWYVYDSQHNYEKGNYITHIYAYDTYGNGGYIGGIGYSFANRFQPTEFIYDGHKYEVYNDLLSWSEAKAKCEELGGHLVTITSQGEQDAVTQVLQSEPRLSYFIGGQAVNGNPTWITGEKFEYSNWYPGEPNNWSGVENVYQMYKDAGKWNDVVDAKDSIGFICEYEPQKEEVIPPQDEDDDTPSSGEDNTNDPTEDEPEGFWVEDIGDYTYTGKEIKPTVKVYDGTTLLKEKKDYTVAYKNNTKANDASNPKTAPTITVTGKGNYSGSHTIYFIIEPVDIAGDDFTVDNMTVTYTGKKQTPTPTLKWKGKKLEYGKDFYVPEYNNAKNDSRAFKTADTYNLTVVGKKNFAGEIPITLTISASKKQIAMNKVTVKGIKDVSWSGKQQTQTGYKVSYKKDVLSEENGDYTVTWGTNTDVGTGTVTFTGTGLDTDGDGYSYIGTKIVSFKINGTSMSNVTISGINKKYTYTGDEIKPVGTLAYKPKKADPITLIEGTHYTVSYKNNLDKGTATISYKGLASGGFTGTKKVTFEIKAKGIATKIEGDTFIKQIEVTFVDTECMQQGIYFAPYMKGGAKPEVIVTCGDKTLTKGKDYTISYENNKKIALSVYEPKPAVVIKGKGNYSGTEREYFWIRGKQMSNGFGITVVASDKAESTKKNGYRQSFKVYDADGTALGSKDYDTKNVTYTLIQTESEDGTITDVNKVLDKNSVVPANSIIQITVKGKGAYAGGEATGTYRILEKGYNISKATIQIKNQTYTGGQIQITDQSQFKSGKVYLMVGKEKKELVLGKEIEVVPGSYIKNVKAGTAKVTFRGINDFGGTKTVSFKIKSKKFLWW